MSCIDLSHPISKNMSTYPSDPKVEIIISKTIEKNNSLLHEFKMGTHTGTHVDAPSHIIKEGQSLSDLEINHFMGKAIKLNKSNYNSIQKIKQRVDAIIFETSWYKNFHNPTVFYGNDRPEIPSAVINYCLSLNVKIFGCDLPSVDKSGVKYKKNHNLLLNNNIVIYESLNNLSKIPELTVFNFYGFPLPFKKLDGSPVRAVGVLI